MRSLLNISAVLACGMLAGVCGLIQGQPSRAASVSGATLLAGSGAMRPAQDAIIPVRRAGSVEAHFAAANITHDGHLTRDQALQSDWSRVARHFDEIDTDHKGWITVEQIHAYNKSHVHHRKEVGAS
ncbi:hypothetical protein NFI95_02565 [Acetobacteraceae bacterium KSS8]|uniref:EF-hand domain-containing protein n=1 Tax=Endosaccharibacter trunci TaxID=2812733 RepID=A0ABT1W395_9PROT|nr:hypothetical protein [Acetobacteraceae bacterium KSS8]